LKSDTSHTVSKLLENIGTPISHSQDSSFSNLKSAPLDKYAILPPSKLKEIRSFTANHLFKVRTTLKTLMQQLNSIQKNPSSRPTDLNVKEARS